MKAEPTLKTSSGYQVVDDMNTLLFAYLSVALGNSNVITPKVTVEG